MHSRRPLTSIFPIVFFFFNDTATTEIYTLSLHDALPIYLLVAIRQLRRHLHGVALRGEHRSHDRSEEHTSELQSQSNLVCRLLLEKKNNDVTPSHCFIQLHPHILVRL